MSTLRQIHALIRQHKKLDIRTAVSVCGRLIPYTDTPKDGRKVVKQPANKE